MITNLVLAVFISISTNWTTMETTYQNCTNSGCLVYHVPLQKQIGIVSKDTFVRWTNGTEKVVESVPIETIHREIRLPFNNIFMTNRFEQVWQIEDLTNEINKTR